MANILIWMSPESGHILPTIKICRDLKAAGHKIIYQVPPAQQKEVEQLGFETIGFFKDLCRSVGNSLRAPLHSALSFYTEISKSCRGSTFIQAFRQELLNAAQVVRADLLIVDGVFEDVYHFRMHELLPTKCRVVRLWIHLPYRPIADMATLEQRSPVIFLSPKDFEIPQFVYDNAFYTEGSPFEGGDIEGFPWSSIQETRSTIYCSFGSQIERYPEAEANLREIISAAKRMPGHQFVLNAGMLATKLKDFVEENVFIFSHVPQTNILKRSTAMILHGGFGSVKDCIYHRIPMLVIPQKWDQPLNAKRVNYHRIGISLEAQHVTSQAVIYATHQLVENPTFKQNLTDLRRIFLEQDKQKPTASLLESLLH